LGKGEVFYSWVHEAEPYMVHHEIDHLTSDILYTRGFKYSADSEEIWAYLGGWIYEQVHKGLRGKLKYKK
jgi:hypothetical protein